MINIKTGLIGRIATMLDSEFVGGVDDYDRPIQKSKNEINDKNRTYEITMREQDGGSWGAFLDLFKKTYETFKDEMDFNPPAMHEWDTNGGTSAKFFYEGNPYMLFVHIDGDNYDKYSISITKQSYNEKGQKDYDDWYENQLEEHNTSDDNINSDKLK